MGWNRIIGQERVKRFFRASLERKRLAPVYLLTGPEGVGKYAVALECAKTVNCENSRTEACDECRTCRLIGSLQHPNFNLVLPLPVGKNESLGDAPLAKLSDDELAVIREQLSLKAGNPYHSIVIPKATTIKINSIRDIRRGSSLAAFDGAGKKVYVILDADVMNDEGANALLKTLEEPLPDTMLLLTASNPDRLLRTIISRCQQVRFEMLSEESIRNALIARESILPGIAAVAARLGNGSYTRALQYCTSGLFDRRREAVEYLRTLLARTRREFLKEIERTTSDYDRPAMGELLSLMQDWLREAMLAEQGIAGVVAEDEQETFRKFGEYYRGSDYSGAIEVLDRAISLIDKNVYIPLIQLDVAARLRTLIRPATGGRHLPTRSPKGTL
jgi:DNA polymerase III subunit delta'